MIFLFILDSSCQTPQHLSKNTPRKQILKRKIQEMEVASKSSKKPRTSFNLTDMLKLLEENYSPESTMLIRNQLLLLGKSKKGARYSDEFKQFALTLNLLGPKAYKKLSEIIRMPSKATLGRITQKWKIYSGFNKFIFEVIKLKVSVMLEKAKDCLLCIDEMSIKSNLFYNLTTDIIIGFEELPNKRSTNIATSALVVMARGISHNWKMPIAYFFTKNSTNIDDLKEIIFESIRKLKSVGLNVMAVTSDQGPNFYKLVKSFFKLSTEKPYFVVDESPIFYLFDVPHLLKSLRNNFFKYRFVLETGTTDKRFLETMYNLDKAKQHRLAAKLTDEHLNPNNFKKMKVKLAAQIFSHSVAVALHTYIDFEKLPQEAKITANFIEEINKLFDLLNSSNLETCQAFMGTLEQIEFLNKMDTLFSNLKVLDRNNKNVTNTLKFRYGWRLTISSVLELWKQLQQKKYRFLLTRHLNQDCLENYFGQIRNACGNARNPTAIQFCRAFKKMFALKSFDPTEGGNTLEEASDILLTITPDLLKDGSFLTEKQEKNIHFILKLENNDYKNLETEEGNALVYVGGYFLKKCLLKHSCAICANYCNSSQSDRSTLFCELKAYEGKQTLFGGLKVPPKTFLNYLQSLEDIFVTNFNTYCFQNNVGYKLNELFSQTEFIHPCPSFPQSYFLSLYTRVRIYYTLKFANREIKSQSKNKENQKLKILKNL